MEAAPEYARVAIDVEQIDDHRQTAFLIEAGVDRRWLDEAKRDALGARVRAPAELASDGSRAPFDYCPRGLELNGFLLRPATAADVPRLTELVQAAYGRYVERIGEPPRPMTDDYADVVRNRQVTVAERGGEIAGLIVLGVDDEEFVVDNVAVDPSHQGVGVGRILLETAEAAARRAGFDSIHLYTHERMIENLALYSGIGYVEYDRRVRGGASIVYLRKKLG